jgi:hypothetical protein
MKDIKNEPIEAQTRLQIASTLPRAIEKAIASYREFYNQDTPDTAKEFSAHHTACKAAIAHIELLLKLARWAELPTDDPQDQNLAEVLNKAKAELNILKNV